MNGAWKRQLLGEAVDWAELWPELEQWGRVGVPQASAPTVQAGGAANAALAGLVKF